MMYCDASQDLFSLRDELFLYDETLPLKPSMVVANKIDEPGKCAGSNNTKKLTNPSPSLVDLFGKAGK